MKVNCLRRTCLSGLSASIIALSVAVLPVLSDVATFDIEASSTGFLNIFCREMPELTFTTTFLCSFPEFSFTTASEDAVYNGMLNLFRDFSAETSFMAVRLTAFRRSSDS